MWGGLRRPLTAGAGYGGGMQKWEYFTAPIMIHATQQILNNWGEDGWELVSVMPGPSGEQLIAFLKRPK